MPVAAGDLLERADKHRVNPEVNCRCMDARAHDFTVPIECGIGWWSVAPIRGQWLPSVLIL